MARRLNEELSVSCTRCSYDWAREYVSKHLKLPPDHWRVKVMTNAFRQHHWLTFRSQNELAGHLEEVMGSKAKETGFVGSMCIWWGTMHSLWSDRAREDGSPMSVADAWLTDKNVKLLGVKEHKAGVVMVTPEEAEAMRGNERGQSAIF